VIITTNNERALPDAFLRRCLVLRLRLPDATPKALSDFLVTRGRHHFPDARDDVLQAAAERLARERATAREHRERPLPGQAEFLDLLRAVTTLLPGDPDAQLTRLQTLARYSYRKHPDAPDEPA
jgi:MoxR-like ATPase